MKKLTDKERARRYAASKVKATHADTNYIDRSIWRLCWHEGYLAGLRAGRKEAQ